MFRKIKLNNKKKLIHLVHSGTNSHTKKKPNISKQCNMTMSYLIQDYNVFYIYNYYVVYIYANEPDYAIHTPIHHYGKQLLYDELILLCTSCR